MTAGSLLTRQWWVVRTYPDASVNFFDRGVVAVNFGSFTDLRGLPADRDEIRADWLSHQPEAPRGRVSMSAMQLHRFAHEIEIGDMVVTPTSRGRHLSAGIVEGDYEWWTDTPKFRHRRRVRWLRHNISRDALSERAHRELSQRPTIFPLHHTPRELAGDIERPAG
jgi:predicted Mrr-cat superfamily restriction endonuclease